MWIIPYVQLLIEYLSTFKLKQHCLGDSSDVVPPDPIPNSEVKRVSANNT